MKFNRLTCIGLWFLAAANLLPWVARHFAGLPEDLVDGFHGLFIGIAIATLLLGIVRGRRSQCRTEQPGA
jgi:hypothetical protein